MDSNNLFICARAFDFFEVFLGRSLGWSRLAWMESEEVDDDVELHRQLRSGGHASRPISLMLCAHYRFGELFTTDDQWGIEGTTHVHDGPQFIRTHNEQSSIQSAYKVLLVLKQRNRERLKEKYNHWMLLESPLQDEWRKATRCKEGKNWWLSRWSIVGRWSSKRGAG